MPLVADLPTTVLAIALIVATAIAALLGWFCYRLLVDRGHLLLRISPDEAANTAVAGRTHGLPVGSYLTDFALPLLTGSGDNAIVTLSGLVGHPLLLLFLHPNCLFCRALARELADLAVGPDAPRPISIVVGEIAGFADESSFAALPGIVLRDQHGQVARLMRVSATPGGYLVDEGRRTVSPLLTGPVVLLAAARGDGQSGGNDVPLAVSPLPRESAGARTPLPVGSLAPDFTLPMLSGGEWSLATHQGETVILVFADPACPPCVALFSELGSCTGPGIVVISRGDVDENRQFAEAAGIAGPILLQPQRDVARAYRTLETPAAYRIDERGEIMAGPVIGKEAVLDLLTRAGSGTMAVTPAPRASPVTSRRRRSKDHERDT